MKKIIIGSLLTILIFIISLVMYTKIDMHGSLFCVKEGYTSTIRSSTSAYSNKYNKFFDAECCDGLISIPTDLIYEPEFSFSDNNGCSISVGAGGSICSDCGNDICEEWEDRCNCPKDCIDKDQAQFNQQINFNNSESYRKCDKVSDCYLVKSHKPCLAVEAISREISEKEWNEYWEDQYKNRKTETLYKCIEVELDLENSKVICQDGLCEAIKANEK